MTAFISVNDAFESITQEPPFLHPARILWIDREDNSAILITIGDPPKQPWSMSLTELDYLLREKRIRHTVIKVPAYMLALEEEIDAKAKRIRETGWERIQPLLETKYPGEIFFPQAMGPMIAAHAKAINLPRKTLYRLLYRYWLFGGTKNALLPNYVRSGGAGKPKTFANGRINGRPPKYLGLVTETKAKILTEEDKAAIKIGYALYKNTVVQCVTDAYIRTLNKFYRAEQSVPGYSDDDVKETLHK